MQVTATIDCPLLWLADRPELALWLADLVTPQWVSCAQLNVVIHTNTISKALLDIHTKNSLRIGCLVYLESRSLLHRLIMRSKIQSLWMTFFIWISNFSQFGWSKNRKHHQNVCFPTVWVSMINNNCWLGFSEALPLSLSLAHHFLWALVSAPTERPLSGNYWQ